jgi:uncharacterized membrane protein
MNRILKSARAAFFAGLIVLAPLGITLLVISWLVENIGGRFGSYFFFYLPDPILDKANLVILWNLLATLMVIVLIAMLGYLSRYFIGRYFIRIAERVVRTVPFVNRVYGTVKQIVDTFSTQNRAVFTQTVLVEFPRPGIHALGFVTDRVKGEIQQRTSAELWNVFVPTTPNPTSGFLVMFPKSEIIKLDMTVGEGMKVIISGGALVPVWNTELRQNVDTPISIPTRPSRDQASAPPEDEKPRANLPDST